MQKPKFSQQYHSENGIKSDLTQDLLLEAITAVSSSLDVNNILFQLTNHLVQILNATSAYIIGIRDQDNVAVIIAEYQSDDATSAEKISKLEITYDLSHENESLENLLDSQKSIVAHAVSPELPLWRRQQMIDFKVKSSLIVPLVVRGKLVGFADIWESRYRRDFLQNEIKLCEAIAQHAALVLSNAQVYESERRRRQEAEIINEVAENVSASLDLEEVVTRTLQTIRRYLVGIHSCNIAIIEPDGESLQLITDWVIEPSYTIMESEIHFKATESYATNMALKSRQPFWINDLRQYPFANARLKSAVKQGLCSLLYIPLLVKDKPIGILLIHAWHMPRPFTQDEILLCKGVASQAAMAIEHARLYTETRKQATELALLNQISMIAGKTLEIQTLLQEISQVISQKHYPEMFGFAIVNSFENSNSPQCSFVGHLPGVQFDDIELSESYIQLAVENEQLALFSQHIDQDSFFLLPLSRSAVVVPVKNKDKLVALIFSESQVPNKFNSNDIRFLTTLAGQIGMATERDRFYQELRQHAETLEHEVTDRTAELDFEKERIAAILESAGEGIVLTDIDGCILYANPALERQSGYAKNELLGQSTRVFNSGKVPDGTFAELWNTVLEGNYWTGEVINRRKDGSLYDVSLTVTPLRDSTNKVIGFVSVHADITRLKEVERLKNEFTSTVTHELRTPLTNIKTYLSLLERGKPEKRERYVRILHEESDRLTHLIQDLLDLSRLETASPYNYEASVEPQIRLNEILPGLRAEADKRNLVFKENISKELPQIHATDAHFDTVITNLLTNAFSFSGNLGEVSLDVFEENGRLQIIIQDNGPGIPPDEIEKIFDRFFRGNITSELGVPGTGLGLSIVKSIVDRYGGEIDLFSKPGEGARFSVWFPIFE